MNINSIKKTPLALALCAVTGLATMSSNADVYTFSDSASINEGGSLSGVNNIVVPKYFGSAANLVSVQLRITLSVPSFNIQVDNDATETTTGTVSFGTIGSVLYTSNGTSTFNGVDTLGGSNFSVATQSNGFNVTANDTDANTGFDFDSGPDNDAFSTATALVGQVSYRNIDAAVFSQWASGGNVTFDLAADFVTDLDVDTGGGGGAVRFEGVIPTATYFVEVIYTDTIPEPSAALLGGLGLLGLLRRRR